MLVPWTSKLRDWQTRAVAAACTRSGQDFLAMATPAAGKTRFALRVAHQYLSDRAAQRIVVVCPTNHLRTQWAQAAGAVGIQLDPALTNDAAWEARDYHGAVVTYQQVCLAPEIFDRACRHRPTMVILDEVHHAGDGKEWGSALKQAFEFAVFRLALSGTPFRSDNSPIPFVRYQNGVSRTDFAYGYQDAIRDGVCRPIYFPSYEGELAWKSDQTVFRATFADSLTDQRQRERLKTALLHEDWLGQVVTDAHTQLNVLRSGDHYDAGGLIVAMNQAHARQVVRLVQRVTGEQPDLAVSDDPDASAVIASFAGSRRKWLVAVNMVSEGVDIPRLRIGVYATNVSTEMYFRQVVGRFVRMQAGLPKPQKAWLYLPKDPTLVEFAQTIKAERDHVLMESNGGSASLPDPSMGSAPKKDFLPLSGVATADRLIGDQEELVTTDGEPMDVQPLPLHEQKDDLRGLHRNLVSVVARKTGADHRTINAELCRRTGGPIDRATLPQLKKRLWLLESWKDAGRVG
jgi:superfamily II DNA or RNA helicase